MGESTKLISTASQSCVIFRNNILHLKMPYRCQTCNEKLRYELMLTIKADKNSEEMKDRNMFSCRGCRRLYIAEGGRLHLMLNSIIDPPTFDDDTVDNTKRMKVDTTETPDIITAKEESMPDIIRDNYE